MGQTLTHGIYLPDEGERNCYNGLAANWSILDGAVGTIAEHTAALSGKAPLVHTHTKADITDFPAYGNAAGTICEGNDSRLSDARTPVAHTHGKADITDLFNSANTWTGDNTFSKAVGFTKVNATTLYAQNSRVELGDSGLSGESYNQISFWDKNGDNLSYLRQTYTTDGTNALNLFVRNKFLNGVPNTAGTIDYAYFGIILGANKSKEAVFKASLRPYDSTLAYNLGNATYQWNNLYAKNYYYNGVAWGLDKANNWGAIQTISYAGSNVAIALKSQETDIAASPTRNNWHYVIFYDKNSVSLGGYNYSKKTSGNARVYLNLRTKNTNGDIIERNVFFETNQEGTDWNLYPSSNADINLGTSTNKWATFNGVNPGALSLPSESASSVNLDPTNWNTTGTTVNRYTPPADGWLGVQVMSKDTTDLTGQYLFVGRAAGGSDYYPEGGSASIKVNSGQGTLMGQVFIPVISGKEYHIRIKIGVDLTNGSSITARFYTCQGNV